MGPLGILATNLKASLDEVDNMASLLEVDNEIDVMIISDENEMGQVRRMRWLCHLFLHSCIIGKSHMWAASEQVLAVIVPNHQLSVSDFNVCELHRIHQRSLKWVVVSLLERCLVLDIVAAGNTRRPAYLVRLSCAPLLLPPR